MRFLKNALELYINSSIHVSLAVAAFTVLSLFEYELPMDHDLLFFILFASITGYNFVKYAGIAKLHHLSLAKNLRIIQVFSLFSFLALIWFIFQLRIEVIIASGILGLLTLFYAIPIFGRDKNLRSLPGLKIFIIAVVWAGCTVLLPLINSGKFLDLELLVDFIQRVMLVIVLTLPFEIRDLKYDNEKLETIPQRLGVFKAKIFGMVLIILIFASELAQSSFNLAEFLSSVVILSLSGFFLWKARIDQGPYYASFWVEAVPIGYLGVYLLFRFFLPHILS